MKVNPQNKDINSQSINKAKTTKKLNWTAFRFMLSHWYCLEFSLKRSDWSTKVSELPTKSSTFSCRDNSLSVKEMLIWNYQVVFTYIFDHLSLSISHLISNCGQSFVSRVSRKVILDVIMMYYDASTSREASSVENWEFNE